MIKRKQLTQFIPLSARFLNVTSVYLSIFITLIFILYYRPAIAAGADTYTHVANNAGLQGISTQSENFVIRDGYSVAGDSLPLSFYPSINSCSIPGGDGGSQVPSADGKCWLALFDNPIDWRQFGQAYPFILHVAGTGNDSGGAAFCLPTAPCLTLQQAINQAAKLSFRNIDNYIYIDGAYSGPGFTVSGANNNSIGHGISGQYLHIVGRAGSSAATINSSSPSGNFAIEASNGAQIAIESVNLAVTSGGYGVFAQNPGTIVQIGQNMVCSGASGAANCLYAEANALIESASNQTLTVQGSFTYSIQGNTGAYVEFDPALGGTISCGSGLTVPSGGAFLVATANGRVLWSATSLVGCSTTTGDLIRAYSAGSVLFASGAIAPPGNGYTRFYGVDSLATFLGGAPVWTPSIASCANGSLSGGSTNYDFTVNFSGSNSSCQITFGKPSNATAFFSGYPTCFLSTITGGSGPVVGFSSLNNLSLTVVPSTPFSGGQALEVHCSPKNGG